MKSLKARGGKGCRGIMGTFSVLMVYTTPTPILLYLLFIYNYLHILLVLLGSCCILTTYYQH